jgi:hypothetical protein
LGTESLPAYAVQGDANYRLAQGSVSLKTAFPSKIPGDRIAIGESAAPG